MLRNHIQIFQKKGKKGITAGHVGVFCQNLGTLENCSNFKNKSLFKGNPNY